MALLRTLYIKCFVPVRNVLLNVCQRQSIFFLKQFRCKLCGLELRQLSGQHLKQPKRNTVLLCMHLKTQHKEIEGLPEITLGEKMRNGIFLIVLSKYRFIIVENEICVNWICTISVYFISCRVISYRISYDAILYD